MHYDSKTYKYNKSERHVKYPCFTEKWKKNLYLLIYSVLLSFRIPTTGVLSNFFLDDPERIWGLRDVIPNPPDSKILDHPFEKKGENLIFEGKEGR